MRKITFSLAILAGTALAYSQTGNVGINTASPKTTLDINGTLANRQTVVELSSNAAAIGTPTMSQYRISGTATADFTVTANAGNVEGQRLVIFNNTSGGFNGAFKGITIKNGYAVEFIYSNGDWRPTSSNTTVFSTYSSQVKIPPHANANGNAGVPDFTSHANTNYDTNNWWVISKASTAAAPGKPAKMELVYEYQGTPFSLDKLYPILTAANNTSFPDTYLANLMSIKNNGTNGKTRMTVAVNRVDNQIVSTTDTSGNWAGIFLINFLLINSSL